MSKKSIENLKQKVKQFPNDKRFIEQLANSYAQIKDWDKACMCFERFLENNPEDADFYFNHAYHLRFAGKYEKSIVQYQKSLQFNISQPEEVYLNIAIIYSDYLRLENEAMAALEVALKLNKTYIPALYNLANIYEDAGDKARASHLFEEILRLEPSYYDALARLAHIKSMSSLNDDIIKKMLKADKDSKIAINTKININYALGKAYDECKDYSSAIHYYANANELDKRHSQPYVPVQHESYINEMMEVFSKDYFANIPVISDEMPIFICGMFRSGSTLVEQILAAHPKVTAGGEREFFIRLIDSELALFPRSMLTTHIDKLQSIAKNYLKDLAKAFPHAENIIDKRPENYLYVGLIKTLFPNARIIYTERNALDNCLSIYFLRLGSRMNYSSDLSHIAHYYKLQQKLMSYWRELYPSSIFTINYDRLVDNPSDEIKQLVTFLKLDWHNDCLNFHQVDNRVKTASVWQVRKPLYRSSSGRWENYRSNVQTLLKEFNV
jgi:tetratricopeptide (TPR) repeat protein